MTTSDTNLELHVDEMAQRELANTQIIPKSCPWSRYKKEAKKVVQCKGNVTWYNLEGYGICNDCGREVPAYIKM